MTRTLCVVLASVIIVASSLVQAQSTRLGWPADPSAGSDDVFILRQFTVTDQRGYGTVPLTYLQAIRRELQTLAEVAILERAGSSPSVHLPLASGGASRLTSSVVTLNALRLLQLRPAVGRDFTEDDLAAGQAVGILTYGAWQRWFAGRPDAVGRVGWRLGEAGARENVVIIGVLPSDAPGRTPELDPDADVLVLASRTSDVRAPQGRAFAPIVRPAPGVTAGQLQIRLEAASRALSASDADAARFGFRLESLRRPPGRWRR